MSNIDERVVKMEFDNKAFEKGASETMSTLDKLKELLKFDNVNKSFSKLTQAANKVDVSNVSDGIETVNAKLSTMQVVGATAISRVTNSLMNFGKKVVGGTFGQVIQGGINRAFNIEQAKFTIEGLGKDFVQLQEDINYAVRGTAYGFDEAAKAASMMAASGIEAGDEMKASLRGISGMAAMTGDSYSNIADIFGNIAGKGKLSLQEVNRFATRGINVAAKLAEMMGESEEAIRDMVSKGEISFRTFAAAMDEAFGEHATEANRTFNGVLANIKASLARMGESFIHPLIASNERDIMVTEAYGKLNDQLIKVAQNAHTATESNVKARSAITSIIKENDKFGMHNSTMIGDLIKGNEKAYTEALTKAYDLGAVSKDELHKMYIEDSKFVKETLKQNPEYAEKTSEELRKIFYNDKEHFKDAVKDIPKYANMSEEKLDNLYKKYQGFQYNLVSVLQGVKRVFDVIESAVKNSSALSVFLDLAERASKTLSLFFNAIAATFSSVDKTINGKFQHIDQAFEVAFGKNGFKIVRASKLWESFRKSIGLSKADFTNLKDTLSGLWSIFKFFGDAVSAVFKIITSGAGILKPISSVILLITGSIGRFLSTIYKVVDATKIVNTIASAIGGVLKFLISIIRSIVDLVVGFITKITSNPILDVIVDKLILIGNGFSAIFELLLNTGSRIAKAFLIPFETMGVAAEVTGGLVDKGLQAIADGLQYFSDVIQGVLEWITAFINEFVDFNEVLRIGRDIAALFKNGLGLEQLFGEKTKGVNVFGSISGDISKSGGGLIGVLHFIGDSITNFIKNIDFTKIGNTISNGLKFVADGLLIGFGLIITVFETIGKALASIDYIGIAEKFGAAIGKFIEALATIVIAIPSFVAGALAEIANQMPSIQVSADKIGEALGNVLANGIRVVLKIVPLLVRIIWSALKTLAIKMPGILGEFNKEIGNIFGNAFKNLMARLKKFSLKDAFQLLNAAIFYKFLFEILKLIKVLRQSIDLVGSVSRLLGSLGHAIRDIGKGVKENLRADAVLKLAIALGVFIGLAVVLSKIPTQDLVNGGLALSIFAFLLYEFAKNINKLGNFDLGMERIFAQLSLFLVAMSLLIGITALVSKCKTLGQGLAALLYIAIGLGAFVAFIGKIKINVKQFKEISKGMIALSAALLVISIGLRILATAKPERALAAAAGIFLVLAALAGASILISKFASPESLKAIAAFGPAILMISAGLALLSLFDFGTVMKSVVAIAAALTVLVAAAAIASNLGVATGLSILSAAIIAFGAATLMVGTGVYIFISALQTLAMMGQDGSINKLGEAISVLAGCIPTLFEGIGQGILVMVQTLADGATIIADAFMTILQNILTKLLESAQMFATVGVAILLTLLNGIWSSIGQITDIVLKIIIAFTNNVSANMGEIVDSGMQLMISFINGMADGLNAHSEEIWAAVKHLVGEIINFILTGLQSVVKEIPFIGGQISDGIEKAKGSIEKFFGDGKIEKETKKSTKGITKAVEGETKATADKAKKNTDKIPKAMDDASRKSKKSFKGVGKAAGNEFKEIPKMADIADKMTPKGKSSIEAWTKEFAKGATKEKGSDAIKKVKSGAESVDFGPAGTQVFNGFSRSFDYSAWYNQGVKRASAVNKGFTDTENIESPSKVWARYGKYLYEGLANSMRRTSTKFYNTGAKAAKGVNAGFNTSIDLLSSLDLDSLSEPTIRPVLDLSGVKMGLNSLDHMMPNSSYALGLAGSMPAANLAGRNITFNNRITVDGSKDPAQFADEFMHELEIQARTL